MSRRDIEKNAMALPSSERLAIADALYGSVDLPEWQREIIEQRLANYEDNPNRGIRWEQVKKRLWPRLS